MVKSDYTYRNHRAWHSWSLGNLYECDAYVGGVQWENVLLRITAFRELFESDICIMLSHAYEDFNYMMCRWLNAYSVHQSATRNCELCHTYDLHIVPPSCPAMSRTNCSSQPTVSIQYSGASIGERTTGICFWLMTYSTIASSCCYKSNIRLSTHIYV